MGIGSAAPSAAAGGGVPLIRVQDVRKSFHTGTALQGVSFEVMRGETFALLGPNGAGKTTLIRIMLDLIRPDSGVVSIGGEGKRPSVAYLPEERGLYARRKVGAVLEYFGALKGLTAVEARLRARRWLERLEMSELFDRTVGELSKGNQQKIQLAATLIDEPEIAVLDEPFSGLDPVSVRLVSGVIEERHRAGLTNILSSHQMSLVERLCDRALMVHRGRQVLYGRIEDIRRDHSEPALAIQTNVGLEGRADVARVETSNGTAKVFLRDGVQQRDFLLSLLQSGAVVESFAPALGSLDDIFVKVARVQNP